MTFDSWAWSFESGLIIKETMPFRVQFRKGSKYWENLSKENDAAVKFFRTQHIHLKHLGVTMRTDQPDSEQTGVDKSKKALSKLSQMYLGGVDDKTLSIIINMFIVFFAQFAVLESNIETRDLIKLDRAIINKVRTGFSLAAQDMKEIIFLPNQWFGMNVKSFQLTDLEATARELECGLNGEQPHCQSMRARMQAWTVRTKNQGKGKWMNLNKNGLVEGNVRKCAMHGNFQRDKRNQMCNVMIDIIYRDLMSGVLASKKQMYGPLGHQGYKQDTRGALGIGNQMLLQFSTNSPRHKAIMGFIERKTISGCDLRMAETWTRKNGKSVGFFDLDEFELAERAREAYTKIKKDTVNFNVIFEWKEEHSERKSTIQNILDFARSTSSWVQLEKVR